MYAILEHFQISVDRRRGRGLLGADGQRGMAYKDRKTHRCENRCRESLIGRTLRILCISLVTKRSSSFGPPWDDSEIVAL